MQTQGALPSFNKDKGHGSFKMGLKQTHKHGLEMWNQYAQTLQKKWLMQIGTKMWHGWATNNQTHKTYHSLDLKGAHHFPPYNILYD